MASGQVATPVGRPPGVGTGKLGKAAYGYGKYANGAPAGYKEAAIPGKKSLPPVNDVVPPPAAPTASAAPTSSTSSKKEDLSKLHVECDMWDGILFATTTAAAVPPEPSLTGSVIVPSSAHQLQKGALPDPLRSHGFGDDSTHMLMLLDKRRKRQHQEAVLKVLKTPITEKQRGQERKRRAMCAVAENRTVGWRRGAHDGFHSDIEDEPMSTDDEGAGGGTQSANDGASVGETLAKYEAKKDTVADASGKDGHDAAATVANDPVWQIKRPRGKQKAEAIPVPRCMPLDVTQCDGANILSHAERALCSILRVLPRTYMDIKLAFLLFDAMAERAYGPLRDYSAGGRAGASSGSSVSKADKSDEAKKSATSDGTKGDESTAKETVGSSPYLTGYRLRLEQFVAGRSDDEQKAHTLCLIAPELHDEASIIFDFLVCNGWIRGCDYRGASLRETTNASLERALASHIQEFDENWDRQVKLQQAKKQELAKAKAAPAPAPSSASTTSSGQSGTKPFPCSSRGLTNAKRRAAITASTINWQLRKVDRNGHHASDGTRPACFRTS